MAGALGSEAANIFMEKLISGVLDKANFSLGIESDIEDLKQSKPILEAFLLDAEDMELGAVEKEVLKQLSCAVQKMDDLFDERATRAKRRRIMCRSRLTQMVAFFSASSNPLVCLFRDARQVKAIRESLDRIARENKRVGNPLSRFSKTETRKRKRESGLETGPYMISDEVIGRDGDRDKILSTFLDSTETLSVLPLVGMGGIGKTTLAQFVYNNEWVQNHFDVRLWVHVHQVLNFEKVLLDIVAFATDDQNLLHCKMAQLQNRLIPLISRKKCLIVLDNVWDHMDLSLNWHSLENLFRFGRVGSKVLITTRSETVARMTGTVDPYIVGDLEPRQSWRLFQRVAFRQCPEPHLEMIGQEIAHLCRNVPLVIRIIGSLLREKDATVVDWRNFRDELARRSSCDHGTSITQTLKLSYDQLDPSGLRLCFVLWSLFWKGFTISKGELLYLWRAVGYIETHKNQSVVHAAEDYFFRLKSRGLLLERQSKLDGQYHHEIEMHDVIHDLAISLAKSKNKMVDSDECDFDEETRHVSFSKNAEFSSQDFPSSSLFKIKHQLQSLLVLRYRYGLKLKLERLSGFEHLRVFVLQNAQLGKIPSTIGKLIHLRYLDLSGNSFKKLPDSITELVNLIYLNLSGCAKLQELPSNLSMLVDLETLDLHDSVNLQELPRDISKLGKLRHLCLKGCRRLKHMPSGLGKLTDLQTLGLYVVGGQSLNDDDVGGPADLNALNNLEGRLKIVVDGCGLSESEARAANLQAKEKLTVLYITFRKGLNTDDAEVILEGFQPHPNLGCLLIDGYQGERLPSWIVDKGHLLNLEDIGIEDWKGCSFLGSFGRLPHLKYLKIGKCENAEYIESNTTSGCSTDNVREGDPTSEANEANADHNPNANPSAPSVPPLFPSLEQLNLWDLPKLKGWRRNPRSRSSSNDGYFSLGTAATAFPRLKELIFLKVGLEVVPEEFRGLSSLETLYIIDCKQLKGIPEWKETLTSLKQIANLANLKRLSIGKCPGLASLECLDINYGEQLQEIPERIDTLTSLEHLTISGCTSLKSLPKQIANLTNLKSLEIVNCPGLAERCRKPTGEDWPLIQHVPNVRIV